MTDESERRGVCVCVLSSAAAPTALIGRSVCMYCIYSIYCIYCTYYIYYIYYIYCIYCKNVEEKIPFSFRMKVLLEKHLFLDS